jgi:hypothetical protein
MSQTEQGKSPGEQGMTFSTVCGLPGFRSNNLESFVAGPTNDGSEESDPFVPLRPNKAQIKQPPKFASRDGLGLASIA